MTARQRTAGSGERKGARRTRSATPGSLYSQANSSSTGSSLWPNQSSSGSLYSKRRAFGQPASPCERFTAALASRTSCITRGRGGWLNLPHGGLPPPILCQLPGALRSGSIATEIGYLRHVRHPDSGNTADVAALRICANRRLMRRSK